jgi:hypothetical protein
VKLIKKGAEDYVFQMTCSQKTLLFDIIRSYPLLPAEYHRISQGENAEEFQENQQILEQAMAEEHRTKRDQIVNMLSDPKRFIHTKDSCHFFLKYTEAECLMQVLNDIRVGAWVRIGSPEHLDLDEHYMDDEVAHLCYLMETSGHFQYLLLKAISSDS